MKQTRQMSEFSCLSEYTQFSPYYFQIRFHISWMGGSGAVHPTKSQINNIRRVIRLSILAHRRPLTIDLNEHSS